MDKHHFSSEENAEVCFTSISHCIVIISIAEVNTWEFSYLLKKQFMKHLSEKKGWHEMMILL